MVGGIVIYVGGFLDYKVLALPGKPWGGIEQFVTALDEKVYL